MLRYRYSVHLACGHSFGSTRKELQKIPLTCLIGGPHTTWTIASSQIPRIPRVNARGNPSYRRDDYGMLERKRNRKGQFAPTSAESDRSAPPAQRNRPARSDSAVEGTMPHTTEPEPAFQVASNVLPTERDTALCSTHGESECLVHSQA